MSIVNLLTDPFIDDPVFNFTTLGSHENIIFIDLEQSCWLVREFKRLKLIHSGCLDINHSDENESLFVIGEHQHS